MVQIFSRVQGELSFSEYFGAASDGWGNFTFDSALQKYILYIFLALALLLILKATIKALRSALGGESGAVHDTPYRLRKLATRLEHLKEIVALKPAVTYRFLKDEKEEWNEGKLLSMAKKHLIVVISSIEGPPEDRLKQAIEIKYPFQKDKVGVIRCVLLKHMGSKKSAQGHLMHMFQASIPQLIKLEPKRKDVRFNVPSEYPVRIYILADKVDIPIACSCVNFSRGGLFMDMEDAQTGCLEYIIKKERYVAEKELDDEKADKLSLYVILTQPHVDVEIELNSAQRSEYLTDWSASLEMAREHISSLKRDDIIKLLFVLPELPLLAEGKEELLSLENRIITCKGMINTIGKGEFDKDHISLHFTEIEPVSKDTLYQYGLEAWRE